MEQGIESVSLNPDTVVDTWLMLAKKSSVTPTGTDNQSPSRPSLKMSWVRR
jgi:hypothetical protein